uniref:Adenosine A2a receptor n=1 Tax=Paramormyrops kingsleyae TaxID=1676925 RepID=A0A3B3T251_9TELE
MLSDASTLAYFVLEVTIAALAVLGNALVCWAVRINSNLQSVTNFFVVSLAAADIAVGVLAVPFAIAISTGFCAHFYSCLFIACFVLVLTQSSIFSLLAIAIDRYIAIKMPLRIYNINRIWEDVQLIWTQQQPSGATRHDFLPDGRVTDVGRDRRRERSEAECQDDIKGIWSLSGFLFCTQLYLLFIYNRIE